MPVVLAMDIARNTGWALHEPGMPKPFFGTIPLASSAGVVGPAMEQFRQFLQERHELHGGLTDIVFEDQHVAMHDRQPKKEGGRVQKVIDIKPVKKLIALAGMAEWFAHCVEAQCYSVHIGTWRKHFLGTGKLKRDEAKQRAMDECRRLGIDPPDDNAAEACGILDYYLSLRKLGGKPYPVPWRDTNFFLPLGQHG